MKTAKLLAALVITALLLSLAVPVAAAPPADNPGKGPPDFDKVVFVHYPKGEAPGKPPGTPGKGPKERDYVYDGYHWADTSLPVHYLVNLIGSGGDTTFLDGIEAAFQTWEAEPNSYMDFECDGTTDKGMSSLNDQMDSYNVVGWANISADYPGAIAATIFWYNVLTKELVEVDVAMNSDPYFVWWQNPGETWTAGNSTAYDCDVQNIMTHEAGHWLVLGDLYADANSEKTMYGYSAEFELKKRSLDPGDEAGIQAIYPITEEPPTEGTMHVAAIDMSYGTKGPNYFIYTKVTIVDADDVAVSEATVYLEMTLPDGTASGSGDTNGGGTVTFKLKSQQTGTYTSTVTKVVKDGWEYDSEASVTSDSIIVP